MVLNSIIFLLQNVKQSSSEGKKMLHLKHTLQQDGIWVLRSDNVDTCWMPAPSLTVFHCLIQFPQRHSHQTLAFNLAGKMEDQLKVNRAGAKMKDEKISKRKGRGVSLHPAL